ncbi:hypothetical protein L218DRAFT_1010534 [Marasmius fiardii PR-910]|nr:hypothetical protein L218DRAFT_1010534 [Marasmius fiardii PR-910]
MESLEMDKAFARLNTTVCVKIWVKLPIIIPTSLPAFPFFSITLCEGFFKDILGGNRHVLVATFDRGTSQWQSHYAETP